MIERQDIALVAAKGAYTGKPRPWVVIQSDDFRGTDSVIVCAFTHMLVQDAGLLRIDVTPSARNGLRLPCQLQVEKVATIRRSDLGKHVGRLEEDIMKPLETALAGVMGLR